MDQNDELMHYGVLGMKWGVHRATKNLASAVQTKNNERGKKALASLSKHRTKIGKKLVDLKQERDYLNKEMYKISTKTNDKANKLQNKINKLNKKANSVFVSDRKATELTLKANRMNIKLNEIKAYSNEVKSRIEKNEALTGLFKENLNKVNRMLIANGKRFIG